MTHKNLSVNKSMFNVHWALQKNEDAKLILPHTAHFDLQLARPVKLSVSVKVFNCTFDP